MNITIGVTRPIRMIGIREWIWLGTPYRLGVSLDYGGNEGGILELKLTTTGEVERDSEVWIQRVR